jgi:hypothetical protein
VNTGEVATPLALVVAVVVFVLLSAKVPLAPLAGAVKVTTTPLTGCDPLSRTVATRGAENADSTVAVCGVPLVAVIVAGTAAALVRLKFAGVETPLTDAATI